MKKGISTLPDTSSTNPSTSQITNNSHNDEKQSNKEKADRRYKIMMSTLKEASIKEEKERVKSAEQKNEFLKQLETKYENNSKNEQNKTNSKLTKNTVRAPNELLQEVIKMKLTFIIVQFIKFYFYNLVFSLRDGKKLERRIKVMRVYFDLRAK